MISEHIVSDINNILHRKKKIKFCIKHVTVTIYFSYYSNNIYRTSFIIRNTAIIYNTFKRGNKKYNFHLEHVVNRFWIFHILFTQGQLLVPLGKLYFI